MFNKPAIHRKLRRVICWDLDETLVQSKEPTRDPLYATLFAAIREIDADACAGYEEFKRLTRLLSIRHNGNAVGWQELFHLPPSWSHEIYEKAAIPMAEAVCRACLPDPRIISGLQANADAGIDQFLLTQSTKTYCDIVLPHLGLDAIFTPDKVLHVGWAGHQLKTEEGVYSKLREIPSVSGADIRDMVDDNHHNLRAGHAYGGFRTWLNGGELTDDMRPYVFQHHPHIHKTLGALAA